MIQRKVLKNGMTVVFKKRANKVVSVAFAVRFGAINETKENKGIAHFIEHMLYKGTPTRNTQQISEEIEKNGGELNGFTAEQITAFWCKMPSKHLDIALNVLSDMVKNPLFNEKEMNKERQVIFEEMKMYHDNPRMHVFDKVKSLMYKGDFSIPIIGTRESMMSNTHERLKKLFDEIYVPENMILCVVGDANFNKLCKFAEKNFKKGNRKTSYPKVEIKNGSEIEKRKSIDQANLVFAYHVPMPNEEKHHAAQVLSTLMAGGMSSRLFSEIREKRNLAYAVKGDTATERDYAYNQIYVGAMPENVEAIKKLILEEFVKVKNNLQEKELNQVKEQIIGNYLISQEDSQGVMVNLLTSELVKDARDAEKYIEKIKAVKLKDVKQMADIKDYSFFALVPEK
ncbi:MAG: pitrilysin family protein [Candidatus Pacearchaeota archaeon]|jgi:predicted Zn-dependent peptidase